MAVLALVADLVELWILHHDRFHVMRGVCDPLLDWFRLGLLPEAPWCFLQAVVFRGVVGLDALGDECVDPIQLTTTRCDRMIQWKGRDKEKESGQDDEMKSMLGRIAL